MKKNILIVFLLSLSLITTSCYTNAENETKKDTAKTSQVQVIPSATSYSNIKPEEAKVRLENDKGIVLLDVRTQEEYEDKRIPNSILIPVDAIEKDAQSKLLDKDATIFVYCRSGRRSAAASEALVQMGYTNVLNLGGIIDWPYETISGK